MEQIASISNVGLKVCSMCVLPDRDLLWVGTADGVINVFDLKTQKLVSQFEPHKARIYSLVSVNDQNEVWSASDDGSLAVSDVTKMKVAKILVEPNDERIMRSALVIDSNTVWSLVSLSNQSILSSWNTKDYEMKKFIELDEVCTCVCLIPKQNLVWVGGETKIYVIFTKTMNQVGSFSLKDIHKSKVSSLVLSNEEQVWCAADCITVWNIKSVIPLVNLTDHHNKVLCLCKFGEYIISGSIKSVLIWNSRRLTCIARMEVHEDSVTCITSHPETPNDSQNNSSTIVYTGSFDRKIQIWSSKKLPLLDDETY